MAKPKMTDEEREALAAKLDKDLEDFIQTQANKPGKKMEFDCNKTVDEMAEELNNHPAFMTAFDPRKPMSPAMEALQALKYESDDAYQNAENFKEDGNENFKKKKYRWASDSYTQGIKERSADKNINAILYTNRAAAQYHLGNYRSALRDVVFARKFKPDHMKAIVRGVHCNMETKHYADAIKWCDDGLEINPDDPKLMEMRISADKLKRQQEREKRKELAKERKEDIEENKLLEAIKSRGITLAGMKENQKSRLLLSSLESNHPSGAKVVLDDQGQLHWPVLLMYPEYAETDFLASCSENSTVGEHLEHMFGVGTETAPWDVQHKYTPDRIEIYYENTEEEKIYRVKSNMPLHKILKNQKFVVQGGTPAFILLIADSDFAKSFLAKYRT